MLRRTNRPQVALAVAITIGAAALVYGLACADAQSSPSPGQGWRDTTQRSTWQRWKNGIDRQGQARKAKERKR